MIAALDIRADGHCQPGMRHEVRELRSSVEPFVLPFDSAIEL
jgi:hypothetical protein